MTMIAAPASAPMSLFFSPVGATPVRVARFSMVVLGAPSAGRSGVGNSVPWINARRCNRTRPALVKVNIA